MNKNEHITVAKRELESTEMSIIQNCIALMPRRIAEVIVKGAEKIDY
jgi:hypothetical protein